MIYQVVLKFGNNFCLSCVCVGHDQAILVLVEVFTVDGISHLEYEHSTYITLHRAQTLHTVLHYYIAVYLLPIKLP